MYQKSRLFRNLLSVLTFKIIFSNIGWILIRNQSSMWPYSPSPRVRVMKYVFVSALFLVDGRWWRFFGLQRSNDVSSINMPISIDGTATDFELWTFDIHRDCNGRPAGQTTLQLIDFSEEHLRLHTGKDPWKPKASLQSPQSFPAYCFSQPGAKVIIGKSRGGRFLWIRNWDLGWIWADWQYWKKGSGTILSNFWGCFFMFSGAKKILFKRL